MHRYQQSADAIKAPSLLRYKLIHLQSALKRLQPGAFITDHLTPAYIKALNSCLVEMMVVLVDGGNLQTDYIASLVTTGKLACTEVATFNML